MAQVLTMVWQLCFAFCNREKQMFQPCYGDNQSPCRTDSFFSKMQFHYTQRGKKIFPRNRRVPRELKQLPPRSSLPSLPIAPIIGREYPWLAGLGGLSSAVQRTVCPLKSHGVLHASWQACHVAACRVITVCCRAVSLLTALSQHSWSWNKSTEGIKKVQLMLVKHLRC